MGCFVKIIFFAFSLIFCCKTFGKSSFLDSLEIVPFKVPFQTLLGAIIPKNTFFFHQQNNKIMRHLPFEIKEIFSHPEQTTRFFPIFMNESLSLFGTIPFFSSGNIPWMTQKEFFLLETKTSSISLLTKAIMMLSASSSKAIFLQNSPWRLQFFSLTLSKLEKEILLPENFYPFSPPRLEEVEKGLFVLSLPLKNGELGLFSLSSFSQEKWEQIALSPEGLKGEICSYDPLSKSLILIGKEKNEYFLFSQSQKKQYPLELESTTEEIQQILCLPSEKKILALAKQHNSQHSLLLLWNFEGKRLTSHQVPLSSTLVSFQEKILLNINETYYILKF